MTTRAKETTTHEKNDVNTIEPMVKDYLEAPRVTLMLSGTLSVPTGLATSKATRTEGKTNYQALPRMYWGSKKPIVPGENISGGLRRALMDDITAAYETTHGKRPYSSVVSFFQMRVGGVSGLGSHPEIYQDVRLRAVNPFISLWGKAGLAGRFGITHAVPISDDNVVGRLSGYRCDDFRRNPDLLAVLSPSMLSDYRMLRVGSKSKADADLAKKALFSNDQAARAACEERFKAMIEDTSPSTEEEDVPKDPDKEGTMHSILNPYGGFEYFLPNTHFQHRITLSGLTETEAALAVGALYAFSRMPRLGGHWRNGLGWVDAHYQVLKVVDNPLEPAEPFGEIRIRSRLADLSEDGFSEEALKPAFEATGEVKGLLNRYLALREAGFPGCDFDAGADDDKTRIKNGGRKNPPPRKKRGKAKAATAADNQTDNETTGSTESQEA